MIALLKGIVDARIDPYLIIDVNGVGYKVLPSHQVLSKLTGTGSDIKLYIYTHVREDLIELYGFEEVQDLRLFEQLISVSGIGPKTAIGIFTVGSRSAIASAVMSADVAFFTGVPRLGKKNAQKLIIELKGKLGSVEELNLGGDTDPMQDDVVAALKNFGYSVNEAVAAVRATEKDGKTTSEKIRLALQYLGK
jgi:Holliday junction DNA helicase RuvA